MSEVGVKGSRSVRVGLIPFTPSPIDDRRVEDRGLVPGTGGTCTDLFPGYGPRKVFPVLHYSSPGEVGGVEPDPRRVSDPNPTRGPCSLRPGSHLESRTEESDVTPRHTAALIPSRLPHSTQGARVGDDDAEDLPPLDDAVVSVVELQLR